ncbi:hypothetical protein WICPIJ_002602 [Wickerhamomyces pijperi]|uniref:Uncharacterized protein n=1 Tax=Wickerhamomyces pijperi TaxID=599730 RepID=A0A9P8Q8V1_WICPI|nr:hypothetical protein WICPIJ_002602 [Wickerhamomyces pijperi]
MIKVTPSPTLDPSFAAWLVWSTKVKTNPTYWNDKLTRAFQIKLIIFPTGSPSMKISSPSPPGFPCGFNIVDSQYGGDVSDEASMYVGGRSEVCAGCKSGLALKLLNTPSF